MEVIGTPDATGFTVMEICDLRVIPLRLIRNIRHVLAAGECTDNKAILNDSTLIRILAG